MIPGGEGWLDPNNNRAFLAGEVPLTNNGISIYFAAKNDFPEIAADMNHAVYPQGSAGRPTELHLFSPAVLFKYTKYPNATEEVLRIILGDPQDPRWNNPIVGYGSH